MNKITTKINSYSAGVKIVNNNNFEKRILNLILFSLFLFAFCYAIFLANTIYNVVERQTLSKEVRTLSNEVSEMELVYLNNSNKIDTELAYSLGFKENNKQYTTRKPFSLLNNIKLAKNEI